MNNQNLKLINRRRNKNYKFNQILLIPYQKYLNKQFNTKTICSTYLPNLHTLKTKSLIRDLTQRGAASCKAKKGKSEYLKSQVLHQLNINQKNSWRKFSQRGLTILKLWNLHLKNQMRHHQEAKQVFLQLACFHLGPLAPTKKMKSLPNLKLIKESVLPLIQCGNLMRPLWIGQLQVKTASIKS